MEKVNGWWTPEPITGNGLTNSHLACANENIVMRHRNIILIIFIFILLLILSCLRNGILSIFSIFFKIK